MNTIKLKTTDDIDKLKTSMHSIKKNQSRFDARKYSGTITLKEDPVKYQNRSRLEWNESSD